MIMWRKENTFEQRTRPNSVIHVNNWKAFFLIVSSFMPGKLFLRKSEFERKNWPWGTLWILPLTFSLVFADETEFTSKDKQPLLLKACYAWDPLKDSRKCYLLSTAVRIRKSSYWCYIQNHFTEYLNHHFPSFILVKCTLSPYLAEQRIHTQTTWSCRV